MACCLAVASFCQSPVPSCCDDEVRPAAWYGIFYEYYQISRDDESDAAETEPQDDGELRSEREPSHSPFGFVWQIADATGWSVDYILRGVNYQTLMMMLADAPRYVKKKTIMSEKDEALDILSKL